MRDPAQVIDFVEGTADIAVTIDATAVHAALSQLQLKGSEEQMLWEAGSLYITADITPMSVQVSHNTIADSAQAETLLKVLLQVLEALTKLGLHVWDPQQDGWLPL